MPKKHNRYPSVKPVNTPHPSLQSSSSNLQRHGDLSSGTGAGSSATQARSVNDLIQHLRRTQVTQSGPEEVITGSPSVITSRTVHPSIRNLLELPETPPPRPRHNARLVPGGLGRRVRRTPGPPPPSSWLAGNMSAIQRTVEKNEREGIAAGSKRVLYRLERLPGVVFPAEHTLQHIILISMALRWTWHLEYDDIFIAELPNRIKTLLLSYIAVFSRDLPLRAHMHGLYPLFTKPSDGETVTMEPEITRLDLSGAIGRWISLKLLSNQLTISQQEPGVRRLEAAVPSSWDAKSDSEFTTPSLSLLSKSPIQTLRFENLRYLSLAHPDPINASWTSLLSLLTRISTLTHLSLAHWPVPTLTPKSTNAWIRHPTNNPIFFTYDGTDTYSASENNWAEAAGVLRKLSRATYCLKWLDLEGCGEWFGALSWNESDADGEVHNPSGPEWTGSWRDIEWVGLGPGWLPESASAIVDKKAGGVISEDEFRRYHSRPLAESIHSPSAGSHDNIGAPSSDPNLPWDIEIERIRYRQAKELQAYEDVLRKARVVEKHVHRIRKENRGKWVHFSLGGDGEDERNCCGLGDGTS